jgi:hypothetical protein
MRWEILQRIHAVVWDMMDHEDQFPPAIVMMKPIPIKRWKRTIFLWSRAAFSLCPNWLTRNYRTGVPTKPKKRVFNELILNPLDSCDVNSVELLQAYSSLERTSGTHTEPFIIQSIFSVTISQETIVSESIVWCRSIKQGAVNTSVWVQIWYIWNNGNSFSGWNSGCVLGDLGLRAGQVRQKLQERRELLL